jgi:hypothetical protein
MGDVGVGLKNGGRWCKRNFLLSPVICPRGNCLIISLLLLSPSIRIETMPPDVYPQVQRRERVLLAAETGAGEIGHQVQIAKSPRRLSPPFVRLTRARLRRLAMTSHGLLCLKEHTLPAKQITEFEKHHCSIHDKSQAFFPTPVICKLKVHT